jgi:cytochrome c peroxidase
MVRLSVGALTPSVLAATLSASLLPPAAAAPQVFDIEDAPPSLDTVPNPFGPNLGDFVQDMDAALILGKALFWDEQMGSDARVVCATCHFNAGADGRIINTVAPQGPGGNGVMDTLPVGGTLTQAMFPIVSDDVVGSQGVVSHTFDGLVPGSGMEAGTLTPDLVFGTARRVTGRNTPTVINAVFNTTNFWDGRAAEDFNGANPSGALASICVVASGGAVNTQSVFLLSASVSSQASGPPMSDVETAFTGRRFSRSRCRRSIRRTRSWVRSRWERASPGPTRTWSRPRSARSSGTRTRSSTRTAT